MKVRYEYFGGIVCTEKPELTVFVDKNYMKELGYEHSPLWLKNNDHYLTAPLNPSFPPKIQNLHRMAACL